MRRKLQFISAAGIIPVRQARWILSGLAWFLSSEIGNCASPQSDLDEGFRNPPEEARPRTWWHWTGGNVTRDGIVKDLEWMKRAGLAGFQLADVSVSLGQTVEPKTDFASPEWFEAVNLAAETAERLDLEMAVFTSAGWSLAGGPWVRPEQAMKKLVWSETAVNGPGGFHGRLPQPPSRNGPIRDLGSPNSSDPTHYGDSAVIAFRIPDGEPDSDAPLPLVSTQDGPIDGTPVLDDSLMTAVTVPAAGSGGPSWLQYEFAEPFTARGITISGRRGIPVGRLAVSDDGEDFRTLVALPGAQPYRQARVRTFAFPATTARFFRVEMTNAPLGPAQTMAQQYDGPAERYIIQELRLHRGARVHRWEEKAGFGFLYEYDSVSTQPVAEDLVIPSSGVIDLSSRLGDDGTLDWEVPEGRWMILRLGYSLTGAKNRPATEAGLGYEVDKLNPGHVSAYYDAYAGPLAEALGPRFGKVLSHMLLDSWEAGTQNWTEEMIPEFERRRGYDPTPYLPALTGRIVGSAVTSERFLWDFRRTLADMFAENFYQVFDRRLEEDGLESYSEASGVSLEIPEDTLLNKSMVDIPMGEFWFRDLHPRLMYYQDVRGAASAAHVYGKPIVGAESFTGGNYESPYALKAVCDYWFAQGINRLVLHTSAHQPLDTKPGNVMVGTHFHRNVTWAEQAKPFMDYLSRCSHMLQRGRFVADLLYLLEEGAPSTMPIWGAGLQPAPPAGHDYDYINVDALLRLARVSEDGRIVLDSGMSYRVLVLPEVSAMRPETVGKLRDLVEAGATIVGPRPGMSPSLMGQPLADEALRTAALDLWGDLDGISRTMRPVGKGRVCWGLPLEAVLAELGVTKDFDCDRDLGTEVAWLHRREGETEIYFLANLEGRERAFEASFRTAGKAPELWDPVTGTSRPSSFRTSAGRSIVPLRMMPHQSLFLVFREPTGKMEDEAPNPVDVPLGPIEGPWTVSFPPDLGAPESIEMPALMAWTEHESPGVRHFSGTATYSRTVEVPQDWIDSGAPLRLDLGAVADVATVTLNGEKLGTLWCPPFVVDVSGVVRAGENQLEIEVTNQWTNRLIGDTELPESDRILDAGRIRPGGMFGATPGLSPSGLPGPVRWVARRSDP